MLQARSVVVFHQRAHFRRCRAILTSYRVRQSQFWSSTSFAGLPEVPYAQLLARMEQTDPNVHHVRRAKGQLSSGYVILAAFETQRHHLQLSNRKFGMFAGSGQQKKN